MTVHWPSIDHVLLDMDGTVLDLAFDNYFWGEVVPARYAAHKRIPFAAAHAELRPHFEALRGTLPWYSLAHWSALTGLDRDCTELREMSPCAGLADSSAKRVGDPNPRVVLTVAHVLGEDFGAPYRSGSLNDRRVPVGEVEPLAGVKGRHDDRARDVLDGEAAE